MSTVSDDQGVRKAGQKAITRNRASRRKIRKAGSWDGRTSSGLIIPDPEPSPEHYHIIYHVPADDISIPRWDTLYSTLKEANEYVRDLGQKAEPNVEWYEDGRVGIETPMHGRSGLFWIVLEVAACIRSACVATLRRDKLKRSLILLPGKR
jgi:hypothetical protein